MKVLFCDDNLEMLEKIENDFRRQGYDFKVICTIKKMTLLDKQDNIQKIIQFIDGVFTCSNKKLDYRYFQ